MTTLDGNPKIYWSPSDNRGSISVVFGAVSHRNHLGKLFTSILLLELVL